MRARDNPFASHRLHAVRARPPGGWGGLMARLSALDHRGALVGAEGRGKTTLLEALAPRLAARGFAVRATSLGPRGDAAAPRSAARAAALLAGVGPRSFLLLDGADRLGRAAWLRFRRRSRAAGGLVVTAHRPGLLPTLARCTTSPALLEEIVGELLAQAVAAGEAPPPLPPIDELFARHRGDLRAALRELYDRCAGRRPPEQVSRWAKIRARPVGTARGRRAT